VAISVTNNLQRPEPQALAATIEALAARFGNRLITSQAVRDQHAHTTTWLAPQPPDAVVMAQETSDIQDVVRICARHGVPVIAFGPAPRWRDRSTRRRGASASTCAT
jgi:D-lactate dehydrogenase (cytochrome)